MINSRLHFHGWKSITNHWLPTKGRVPNALVYELGGLRDGELNMHVCKMCMLELVTFARIAQP